MGIYDDGAGARGRGDARGREGRTEALVDTFNTQGVANMLWAYATMEQE